LYAMIKYLLCDEILVNVYVGCERGVFFF